MTFLAIILTIGTSTTTVQASSITFYGSTVYFQTQAGQVICPKAYGYFNGNQAVVRSAVCDGIFLNGFSK